MGKDIINLWSTVVGNEHLLDKSPEDEPHAFGCFRFGEGTFSGKLWQQVATTLNGTCHKLGKEADEGKEVDE